MNYKNSEVHLFGVAANLHSKKGYVLKIKEVIQITLNTLLLPIVFCNNSIYQALHSPQSGRAVWYSVNTLFLIEKIALCPVCWNVSVYNQLEPGHPSMGKRNEYL